MPDAAFTWTAEVRPVCELGISDVREAEPDSWLDVSCYVHEAELFRGRDRFTDRFEPGTASITFSNTDGWADLAGSPAVVAGQTLRPGRPIRVGVAGIFDGLIVETRWLWRGWIDQTTPLYDPVEHDVVVANCIDALGEAGSAPAPAGPFVGANETAAQRINRVLDAVEWFGTKRKIDVTTTTVQGTSLGGQGIDLMGQAADSAGGVVHGDLDGDVVFRDLNWMLYDPDTPPDATIGNVDPGTPGIPFEPGYIDPDTGYVYWPDPPPLDSPTVITVCSEAGDGSLVAQGDLANLYVEDGQLRFASSGQVWDLGPDDGGCRGVIFDPDTGTVTRVDDGDGDGVYDIAPFPAPELPTQPPLVELLDWGQSATATTGFTSNPITPGPDCLIVVWATSLTDYSPGPIETISGGPTWIEFSSIASIGSPSDHAENAKGWVAEIGRDDPGTFTVTVDWQSNAAFPQTALAYGYTIWKVTDYVSGTLSKLQLGFAKLAQERGGSDAAMAALWDTVSENPSPQRLRPQDVTIAQALADSTSAPFGATFGVDVYNDVVPDITPVVSWVAGWRTGVTDPYVNWDDTNIGTTMPGTHTSVLNGVVIEPTYPLQFRWQTLGVTIRAPATTLSPTNFIAHPIYPSMAGNLLVVFVGATADHDFTDDITVGRADGGVTFSRVVDRPKTGASWAQGGIWTATVSTGHIRDGFGELEVRWPGHTIKSCSIIVYEVEKAAGVGAGGSTVMGDNTAGSVDGPVTVTLSAAPDVESVTLGGLFVMGGPGDDNAAQTGGDEWVDDRELAGTGLHAYVHAQSRAPGQPESTDATAGWNDVRVGTATQSDAVALAVEIASLPGFVLYPDDGADLVLGGLTDAYSGDIYKAQRRTGLDPNDGDVIWDFDAGGS